MNWFTISSLLTAYLAIGVLWTEYQLWRIIHLRGGHVLWHYSLSFFPRYPISKSMVVLQTMFWLPVLGTQLTT